jgi:lipopolysaccharide biosynthesis glycosyltransferase
MVEAFLPPDVDVTVCGGFSDLLTQRPALGKLAQLHNSSRVKRKELLSPFNFAAFYLPYVLRESKRVLYLDTDIIVEGDVSELDDLDMHGESLHILEII